MSDIENAFCLNKNCKDYGVRNQGNISKRGKYGKYKKRILLYCRTCGTRFAATKATAFFGLHLSEDTISQIIHHAAEGVGVRATARLMGIDKDTVNRVILRAGEHCELVLSNLLCSLNMTEVQLDELWAFVKKRKMLVKKNSKRKLGRDGYGRHSTLKHG